MIANAHSVCMEVSLNMLPVTFPPVVTSVDAFFTKSLCVVLFLLLLFSRTLDLLTELWVHLNLLFPSMFQHVKII
jgi:hypothetical protein